MGETNKNIATLMLEKYGLDISMFDESFITKGINSRVNELSMKDLSDYMAYLDDNSSEPVILYGSLNNSYSEFFRNPYTFLVLEQIIFPQLIIRKALNQLRELRIWSAGCAAGQEPYSLAILAEDYKNNNQLDVSIRIFATDKNEKELSIASKGIYHFRSVQNARLYHVNNYFSNTGEYYLISAGIKKNIEFSVFDLLDESSGSPPSSIYGDFEIVMCSNLLFYYKPEIQKRILTRLSDSLVSGGFLITGEAEVGIVNSFRGFKQYSPPAAIFIRQ